MVIAVGQQLAAKQAELEALGCEEVAADLAQLQADEKEKLRCELTLQVRPHRLGNSAASYPRSCQGNSERALCHT